MKKSKAQNAPAPKTLSEKEISERNHAALDRVAEMDDPDKLRNLMLNAERMGVDTVREAAFRRLALVQTDVQTGASDTEAGSTEYDLWQTIFAYEQLLREDRGKAVRLTKTRTKLTKSGAVKALETFADATDDTGSFDTLVARGWSDMTGEAVILRHADNFDAATRDAAFARLEAARSEPETKGDPETEDA